MKIMFQGTGSSVGKSLLTAALLRALKNRGITCSPFKAQNMALNSFITKDGHEIGRAQAMQSEAAKIDANVLMNPVLLKPTKQTGCQVILNGRVHCNMKANEYYDFKKTFLPSVLEGFDKLKDKYDAVVVEGAGSPAEINLRKNDIVNMGFALERNVPVLLIGDIDKGGVFASIYGTLALISEEERELIKGFVINKFRGDVKLLEPGIKMIEDLTGKKCYGVVPFMKTNIDDEDSVSTRLDNKKQNTDGKIKVGVIRLPYISNFTDFTALEFESDVSVKYIEDYEDTLYDILIIPGSKNTIHDLEAIYEKGMNELINKHNREGRTIIGICGGYQMLGKSIEDNEGVESENPKVEGLGLIKAHTKMATEKTTTNTSGRLIYKNKEFLVNGYEIHMGKTVFESDYTPLIYTKDGNLDGYCSKDELVIGTYFHGIFDNDEFRHALLSKFRDIDRKQISYKDLMDEEYEKLASHFIEHTDFEGIMDIMRGDL